MSNLYDVLEICLQEMENGADVDTVLFRYPEFADELRPILETSVKARNIAAPDPSSDIVRRNRAKVMQHAAQMREANSQPSRRVWSAPLRRVLVSLAVIAALFISSTSLVRAASTTLPGDNLYPVKRTWEDVRLLLTFNTQVREALEVEHENERLEELYELFAEGRSAEVDFAGRVTRQNGDLWLVAKIPVVVSAQTDLRDGPVTAGDAIRVRGVTQADGSVLAERVDILDESVALPEVEDDDGPEIEHDNSGNENESGEDNSGKGSATATPPVIKKTATPKAPEKVDLDGVVSSIDGNILIVDGITMDISNADEIKGTPAAGVEVKVEGYYDANGVFIVTKIEFLKSSSGGGDNSDSNDNGNDDDNRNDNDRDDNNNNGDDDNDDSGKDDNGGGKDDDDGDDNSGSGGGGDD